MRNCCTVSVKRFVQCLFQVITASIPNENNKFDCINT